MITIILTSTVNVNFNKIYLHQINANNRLDTYLKSVNQWLTKTNFNIILVENSGYEFNELNAEKETYKHRFEVITFNEQSLPEAGYLINNNSKGASEFFSIDYVYRHSKILHLSKFVIKVTARFYIDELENYLMNFNLDDYNCLTQHDRDRCEMVGSHYNNFLDIFNTSLYVNGFYTGHVEYIWKVRTLRCENVLVCKEFTIEETQRGGINEKYTTI